MKALLLALLAPGAAWAQATCDPAPDYDEQAQQDFLQNVPALALTYSPLHGPVPHEGGRGALGVDVAVIPPLSCERRLVLYATKTEDANVTPVAPKIHAGFAFPGLGTTSLYVSTSFVPPVPIAGQSTLVLSGELGVGGAWIGSAPSLQLGGRLHATTVRTQANLASAFRESQGDEVDDLYIASTLGIDALVGWAFGPIVPYVAVGFTDVSTFFYVGDTGNVTNNQHPYASFTFSAGVDGLVWDRFRWSAEFYGAPGGYAALDSDVESPKPAPAYGHLYTGRARLAYEF